MPALDDYTIMEYRLKRNPDTYYSGEELAKALRKSGQRPMPPVVQEYFCAFLEGKVKKKRGRKSEGRKADHLLRYALAKLMYERTLQWLQRREKKYGLKGWACIRGADWWQEGDSPHERAAKMVRQRYYREKTARSVLNLFSKMNSR